MRASPQLPVRTPEGLSRRRFLQLGAGALGACALTGLSGCASSSASPSSQLVHGATGGGLKDSLDPHFPVTVPDIARVRNLFEPLLRYSAEYQIEPALAESWEHNADATEWTFRLRDDVIFHNGKPLTAEDVKFSIERMADPKEPAAYMSAVSPIIDLPGCRALDDRTYRLKLNEPYTVMDMVLGSYSLGIVPADFDVANPIGTGPFKAEQFIPGQRSTFNRFDDYWEQKAHYESLTILDFADEAAKVNALLAGQVHTVDNLPRYLTGVIEEQGAIPMITEGGGWLPFTMRVDQPPFQDRRVRLAMRLIVDRQEMIDQALNGHGRIANDLYAPFDPAYAGNEFPQRQQDIEQAKSLLKQAGQEDLQVEVVTSSGVGAGAVEAANLFAFQASKAGVDVRVNKVDSSIFYGDQYLSWIFAQDFWETRMYIQQAEGCALKSSPYNETHFYDERFEGLIKAACRELDPDRRKTLLQDAQQIEYDEGGLIIWAFRNQVDAHSQFVTGLKPARELPVNAFRLNNAIPVEQP